MEVDWVEKASWYSPIINKSYHEMSEHYGCANIPARVKKPKDKPSAEGTVGVISTWYSEQVLENQSSENNYYTNYTNLYI